MLELNKVYNMDCLDLMREMIKQGIKADTLLTDIPYGEVNRKSNGLRDLDKSNADNTTFNLKVFLKLTDKVIKGNFVIFCGTEQVSEIREFFADKGYTTRLLIWEKTNPSPMNGQFVYLSGIEVAVYARKKNATFNAFCKNTVFKHNSGKNEIHPTEKPLSLWYELLNDLTNENDLVLDTCAGSSGSLVACRRLNRRFIGAELDKEYYEKGQARLNAEMAQLSIFDIKEYNEITQK